MPGSGRQAQPDFAHGAGASSIRGGLFPLLGTIIALGLALSTLLAACSPETLVAQPALDGQIAVPQLQRRVTDLTGTLGAAERRALEEKLAAFEREKGSQIAVLLLPTTGPETIEQYSLRVVDRWKIGRKNVDDGVLLIVAKNDRKLRIEVGYGLEGAIPDAVARRIIDDTIVPRLRENDFAGGIAAGVDRIIAFASGEELPPAAATETREPVSGFIGLVVLVGLVGTFFLPDVLGTLWGSLLLGVLTFVGTLLCGAAFLMSLGIGAFFAVCAFVLAGGLGLVTGSFVAGGYGGSSGGGGGFSGGGGSFGGGGASGGW